MDLDNVKNIAAIAAPLTKVVFETYVKPKLEAIKADWSRKKLVIDHSFENTFQRYLTSTYEKHAVLNTLAFSRRKKLLKEIYLPLTLNCAESNEAYLIDEFSDSLFNESNKILITDTAGMGKSTLSKRLLVSCIEQNYAIPILIELRRLSKDKDILGAILEQLKPINEEVSEQLVLDLIQKGDFVFFLDGYDEIGIADRKAVTEQLQNFIAKANNNHFVLTSRPEQALVSFGGFRNFTIQPLKKEEAYELLRKYDQNGEVSNRLIAKLEEPQIFVNIEEYLDTPLLVSLLFTAFEFKQRIPFQKHVFYRQVFDALFESHDLSKGDSFERDKRTGLGMDEFHRILRILAFSCFQKDNRVEFNKDEFEQLLKKSIEWCDDLNVKVSDLMKDLTSAVPLFVKDGIYYKWAHKSLQEYFTAQFIHVDAKNKQKSILEKVCFHEKNEDFINIIDLYESVDPKGFRDIVVKEFLERFFKYLNSTYTECNRVDKEERQLLSFCNKYYIIKSVLEKKNYRKILYNVVSKLDAIKFNSIRSMSLSDSRYYEVHIIRRKYPINELYEYFVERKYKFIKKLDLKTNFDELKSFFDVPSNELYEVTDDIKSPLNEGERFTLTNNLLKYYFEDEECFIIDKEKAKQTLNEINQSIAKSFDDDLLNF